MPYKNAIYLYRGGELLPTVERFYRESDRFH